MSNSVMMVNRLQMSMVFQQFQGHPYAHNHCLSNMEGGRAQSSICLEQGAPFNSSHGQPGPIMCT